MIVVIRSQKHWYEASGIGCHQNTVPLHRRASRHMNFRVHTGNARQSTGKSLRWDSPRVTVRLGLWHYCPVFAGTKLTKNLTQKSTKNKSKRKQKRTRLLQSAIWEWWVRCFVFWVSVRWKLHWSRHLRPKLETWTWPSGIGSHEHP
jgi:hypothetical protein